MSEKGQDVIGWLLEDDNPSVKYWTLRNLLDYPEDDPRVVKTQQQITRDGPIPMILARMNQAGHFEDPMAIKEYGQDCAAYGYLPKYRGTVWQVILFAELGVDGKDARVRKACEYVLEHSWQPSGLFSMVGNQFLASCFQGNMLYSLMRLGYGEDARVLKALDVLLDYTRFDDGGFHTPDRWPYRGKLDRCSGSHSCCAGCSKALKAVTVLPREKQNGRIHDFVARGADYFLAHRVFRASHTPERLLHKGIDQITFPNFIYSDFLEILTILLTLGVRDARMQDAIDLLKSKQLPNGHWRLERDVPTMHVRLGMKHHESKWATYRAMHAIKLWEN